LLQYPHDPENYCPYLGYGLLASTAASTSSCTPSTIAGVWLDSHAIGAKLIYSPDDGRTWANQTFDAGRWEDCTTSRRTWPSSASRRTLLIPDLRAKWAETTRRTHGYVYVYSPNGNYDGSM